MHCDEKAQQSTACAFQSFLAHINKASFSTFIIKTLSESMRECVKDKALLFFHLLSIKPLKLTSLQFAEFANLKKI